MKTPAAHAVLSRLADVGPGSLGLGQPLTLATHMAEKGGVSVLDEPTSGLPLASVERLLGPLDRLVVPGTSVIVITHHSAAVELYAVVKPLLAAAESGAALRRGEHRSIAVAISCIYTRGITL